MSNSIALISLIILIACIAIGFVLKKNVGLIAILAAAIFGSVAARICDHQGIQFQYLYHAAGSFFTLYHRDQ